MSRLRSLRFKQRPRVLLISGLSEGTISLWRIRRTLVRAGFRVSRASLSSVVLASRNSHQLDSTVTLPQLAQTLLEVLPSGRRPWTLVVGNSLGGTLAAECQAQTGGLWTDKLVLLDPPLAISQEQGGALAKSLFSSRRRTLGVILHREWSVLDKAARAFGFLMAYQTHKQFLGNLEAFAQVSLLRRQPWNSFIVVGASDVFTFIDDQHRIKLAELGHTVTEVENSGHDVLQDSPKTVISHMLQVLSNN